MARVCLLVAASFLICRAMLAMLLLAVMSQLYFSEILAKAGAHYSFRMTLDMDERNA